MHRWNGVPARSWTRVEKTPTIRRPAPMASDPQLDGASRLAAAPLTAAACVLLGLLVVAGASAAERPNVLVILTDDQRWDTLGSMPAVEALAQEGVLFTNSFVTTSLCAPSRASFYSGQYAHHHGVTTNYGAPVFDGHLALPVC